MFTGLIETVGILRRRSLKGAAAVLTVEASFPTPGLSLGDSIAVNGACLTAARFSANQIEFHALSETLRRTNLGECPIGAPVNLERALRLGDRLGGHIVSGHVDGTARVLSVGQTDTDTELRVELPEDLAPQVIMKGSIAINGVSLTIAHLDRQSVGVRIIPHTWQHTNLRALSAGSRVNLETDLFGKYILRARELREERTAAPGLTPDFLAENGFF